MSTRTEFSKPVRREAWKRSGGLCERILDTGTRCACVLTPGKFAYDHVIPDQMGGEAILSNCQVICTPCHLDKTRQDVADIAKAKRLEDTRLGITRPGKIQSQGFRKFAPARRASTPVTKLTLGYRRPEC
jgi:5-methylcytosine-specific restriction protein A